MGTPLSEKQKETGQTIKSITVKTLLEENNERLQLKIITGGKGLDREIEEKELHRPGLALAGFLELFTYHRVQVLGNSEMFYLSGLDSADRLKSVRRVMEFDLPCMVIANDNKVPDELLKEADKKGIPILSSKKSTTDLIHLLSDYLDDKFAPTITVHGSLVDVYGTGMLITGRSGIGKSEISLDLVERGHRLVADDSVQLDKKAEGVLIGTSPAMIRHIMEVRGVGLIDVRRMFGVRGIRIQKRVEVEVRLEEWSDEIEWERIGLDYDSTMYMGVDLPMLKLPIFPGKNISMIAEVIALQTHLRVYGINAADEMIRRMSEEIDHGKVREYLRGDHE